MNHQTTLRGSCHCGDVQIEFGTAIAPENFTPWACDCSFCLKHGASYISDPAGHLTIAAKRSNSINEYRQGSKSARFLVCHSCGVLVAVVFDGDAGTYGTVNSRCIDDKVEFGMPKVVSPQELSVEQKRRSWGRLWTPSVRFVVSDA